MDRLAEQTKFIQHLPPASRNAGTTDGVCVDTSGYDEATARISVGAITATGTLDVKLQEGNAADGSDAADIVGAAIVQLTQAGGDSNKGVTIGVRLGGRGNRKKYIRARAVGATAAAIFGIDILLSGAHAMPVVNSPVSVVVA